MPLNSGGNAPGTALLTARNLKITCSSDAINLSISAGERIGVLGARGSGRRRLFQVLALVNRPLAGDILWCRTNVSRRPRWLLGRYRRHVLMIWGNPYALLEDATRIETVIATPLQQRATAASAVEQSLRPLQSASVDSLSALQRVRAAVAFAQRQSAKVLLLADPFAALVPTTWPHLLRDITMATDQTQALMIASQYPEPMQHVETLYVLLNGAIVEQGPREQIMSNPQHPYTQWLVNRTSIRPVSMTDWEHENSNHEE